MAYGGRKAQGAAGVLCLDSSSSSQQGINSVHAGNQKGSQNPPRASTNQSEVRWKVNQRPARGLPEDCLPQAGKPGSRAGGWPGLVLEEPPTREHPLDHVLQQWGSGPF